MPAEPVGWREKIQTLLQDEEIRRETIKLFRDILIGSIDEAMEAHGKLRRLHLGDVPSIEEIHFYREDILGLLEEAIGKPRAASAEVLEEYLMQPDKGKLAQSALWGLYRTVSTLAKLWYILRDTKRDRFWNIIGKFISENAQEDQIITMAGYHTMDEFLNFYLPSLLGIRERLITEDPILKGAFSAFQRFFKERKWQKDENEAKITLQSILTASHHGANFIPFFFDDPMKVFADIYKYGQSDLMPLRIGDFFEFIRIGQFLPVAGAREIVVGNILEKALNLPINPYYNILTIKSIVEDLDRHLHFGNILVRDIPNIKPQIEEIIQKIEEIRQTLPSDINEIKEAVITYLKDVVAGEISLPSYHPLIQALRDEEEEDIQNTFIFRQTISFAESLLSGGLKKVADFLRQLLQMMDEIEKGRKLRELRLLLKTFLFKLLT